MAQTMAKYSNWSIWYLACVGVSCSRVLYDFLLLFVLFYSTAGQFAGSMVHFSPAVVVVAVLCLFCGSRVYVRFPNGVSVSGPVMSAKRSL